MMSSIRIRLFLFALLAFTQAGCLFMATTAAVGVLVFETLCPVSSLKVVETRS